VRFSFPPIVRSLLWPSIFSSRQFVFVVGENQAAFTVHAAAIASQSPALNVLINGGMAEASEGKADFKDVREDTFARFCQFAYTGNYATPSFVQRPDVELPDNLSSLAISQQVSTSDRDDSRLIEPTPEPEPEFTEHSGSKPKKAKKPSKSRLLRQSLDDKLYNIGKIHEVSAARCEVRQNSSPTEDYTTVFLGHAELYVFAEKWGIESLKPLALHKLHKTMLSFTLYAARQLDIVQLPRYAYYSDENTPDRVDFVDD